MPRDRPAEDRSLIPTSRIDGSILVIRGHKVMLDADLAALYGVETKSLVRAVRRNAERFPADFMFQVSEAEFENLRYQNGTSSSWGGRRYRPYALTEHGVAMLSSVLRSAPATRARLLGGWDDPRVRQECADGFEGLQRLLCREVSMPPSGYGEQLVFHARLGQRLMQPHRMRVRHDLVRISVNGQDRRQAGTNVAER